MSLLTPNASHNIDLTQTMYIIYTARCNTQQLNTPYLLQDDLRQFLYRAQQGHILGVHKQQLQRPTVLMLL